MGTGRKGETEGKGGLGPGWVLGNRTLSLDIEVKDRKETLRIVKC